jgi:hypothetical protein
MNTHVIDVKHADHNRVLSVAVTAHQFASFHPMTQWDFFAIMQQRAERQVGPVEKLVWTVRPDPTYTPPKPPKPEQLGFF